MDIEDSRFFCTVVFGSCQPLILLTMYEEAPRDMYAYAVIFDSETPHKTPPLNSINLYLKWRGPLFHIVISSAIIIVGTGSDLPTRICKHFQRRADDYAHPLLQSTFFSKYPLRWQIPTVYVDITSDTLDSLEFLGNSKRIDDKWSISMEL